MSDSRTVPTGPDHGDDALDAATMLRLLEHQQDAVSRRLAAAVPWILGAWGVAWLVGFGLLVNGMEAELAGIFYPTGSALLVGLLYLIGGGVWHTRTAVFMGAWILLVAAVAPILGSPAHFLVLSLAGGGGFLAVAIGSGVWVAGARSRFDGAPDA